VTVDKAGVALRPRLCCRIIQSWIIMCASSAVSVKEQRIKSRCVTRLRGIEKCYTVVRQTSAPENQHDVMANWRVSEMATTMSPEASEYIRS
jgi:hypothetical protein